MHVPVFFLQPFSDRMTNQLGAVVAAQTSRPAMSLKQFIQNVDDIAAGDAAANADIIQALARECLNHRQALECAPTFGLIKNTVVTPHVVRVVSRMNPLRRREEKQLHEFMGAPHTTPHATSIPEQFAAVATPQLPRGQSE